MTEPDIFEFASFRDWLARWQAARQATDPSFTRTQVSHRLGLPRTRGYFSDVLSGKKVSDTFLERFCELLDLTKSEERYFRTLVRFDQAETPEEKELALDQLAGLHRAPGTQLDPGSWTYYRDWKHGAIRALLETGDHDEDSLVKAAARLQPPITPHQTAESLRLLESLGLASRGAKGGWKPIQKTLGSPPWGREEVFRLLQAQQLDLVRQALVRPGDGTRAIATNLVSVSSGSLDRIRQSFERFREEIRSIVHRDQESAEHVVLIANALLPLTEASP